MEILNSLLNTEGLHFILRWLHTFAGIVWIGHLYYINFVQGGFMNEADATVKSFAQRKLFPKVLWWFRYGALWTFIFGVLLLLIRYVQQAEAFQLSSYWVNISIGAIMATIMAANVWFVIWPAQKLVIASAEQVASGGQAIAEAPARAAQAMVASRTNVMLSVPMLFFMFAAGHWQYGADLATTGTYVFFVVAALILMAIEFNALKGKLGPIATVKGVLSCAFGLWALFVLLIVVLVRSAEVM